MKVLFLLHEQTVHYTDEPAYTEVVKPFLCSGLLSEHRVFVYQRALRQSREKQIERRIDSLKQVVGESPVVVYGAGELTQCLMHRLGQTFHVVTVSDGNQALWHKDFKGFKIVPPKDILRYASHVIVLAHASQNEMEIQLKDLHGEGLHIHKICDPDAPSVHRELEVSVLSVIEHFRPRLIVYTLTFAGENLRGCFLGRIKARFPEIKIYTQWWDHAEHIPALLAFEQECLLHADMVGIIDSHTRYTRIKYRQGVYRDYPCVDKLHWHPTVFDPEVYQRTGAEKKYDICIMGSAEGGRKEYISFLSDTYKDRFHHFGGRCRRDAFITREAYVDILNRTKIFVNTQTSPDRIQLKGKVREALSCGTFLLEEDNPETRFYAGEGLGLDYFTGPYDLKRKIDHYLGHEAEREEIAQRGYDWYLKKNNARGWVGYILKKLNLWDCGSKDRSKA